MSLSKSEATAAAKELVKKMEGKGWKYSIWENFGWHYSVYNGPISVYPLTTINPLKYMCLISSDIKDHSSGCNLWTKTFSSSDPNKAVRHEIASMQQAMKKLDKIRDFVEEIYVTAVAT